MSTAVYTSGVVSKGRLKVRHADVFADQLKRLRDGEVEIRVERKLANRSQESNRFYWAAVVNPISQHTGFSPEETHAVLKQMFLPKQVAMTNGNGEVVGEFVIGGSTTVLDVEQFSEYVNRIIDWASHTLGVIVEERAS